MAPHTPQTGTPLLDGRSDAAAQTSETGQRPDGALDTARGVGRPLSVWTRLALSMAIGMLVVPPYTALGFFVSSYLPDPLSPVLEAVQVFGNPITWTSLMFRGPRAVTHADPYFSSLVASSLLGLLFGLMFNGRLALGAYSVLVHSWRLTILSWLVTAVVAGLVIGFMEAAGVG